MAEDKSGWRQLQTIKVDKRVMKRHARRAEKASIRHAHRFVVRRWRRAVEVRQHIVLWLATIVLLFVTVIVQAYFNDRTIVVEESSRGGTYAEGIEGEVRTLNPVYAQTEPELVASQLLFSSLLRYDTNGHLAPDAAEAVVTQQEGRQYLVLLRDTIRWHDNRKLTADDVMFTVDLIRNRLVGSPLEPQWRGIDVKKLDDRRVQFTLPSVYAAFPHALTFPILPKHVLKDIPAAQLRQSGFGVQPIGSGPFVYSLLQREQGVSILNLKRFDGYYGGAADLDRFELHAYDSISGLEGAIASGRLSAAVNVHSEGRKVGVRTIPTSNVAYAFFNTESEYLKSSKVRTALLRAVDRDALAGRLGSKGGSLQGPFTAQQVKGLNIALPTYDKTAAQKILSQAGWRLNKDRQLQNKDKKLLAVKIATVKEPSYETAAANLKQAWEELGVKVELRVVDKDADGVDFQSMVLQPRDYDVLIYEVELGADPDVYAFWHSSQASSSGLNLSNLRNPLIDDILSSARTTVDDALRTRKYISFAKQWVAQAPAIPLYQANLKYSSQEQVSSMEHATLYVTPKSRYSDVIHWRVERGYIYKTP